MQHEVPPEGEKDKEGEDTNEKGVDPEKDFEVEHDEAKGSAQEEDTTGKNVESTKPDKGKSILQEEQSKEEENIEDALRHEKNEPSKD